MGKGGTMKVKDKAALFVRVTPEEKRAISDAAKNARQSASNYALQAIEERVRREGREWPEEK